MTDQRKLDAEHERLARDKANQLREQGNDAAAKKADAYADAYAKQQEQQDG